MAWYSASIIYKGTHVIHPENSPLWEQSIVLLEADTDEKAFEKAKELAKRNEHEYKVVDGPKEDPNGTMQWTYECAKVYRIDADELIAGTEVFSTFIKDEGIDSVIKPFDT